MMMLIKIIIITKSRFSIRSDNSIQFFIIYVPCQQLQGQLQTQHSAGTGKDKHNIKTIIIITITIIIATTNNINVIISEIIDSFLIKLGII
jgi:hypothetical protein